MNEAKLLIASGRLRASGGRKGLMNELARVIRCADRVLHLADQVIERLGHLGS